MRLGSPYSFVFSLPCRMALLLPDRCGLSSASVLRGSLAHEVGDHHFLSALSSRLECCESSLPRTRRRYIPAMAKSSLGFPRGLASDPRCDLTWRWVIGLSEFAPSRSTGTPDPASGSVGFPRGLSLDPLRRHDNVAPGFFPFPCYWFFSFEFPC